MLRLIPAGLHRAALRLAYVLRRRWRQIRAAELAGVSAILRDSEDRLLLVRHSYGPNVWALPGGGLKRGEAPEAAVRREIREELGCAILRLQHIGRVEEEISGARHIGHIFVGLIEDMPEADRREIMEARLFPAHSLPQPQGSATRRHLDHWRQWMKGDLP